ncbi:hypothetical protein SteCoe_9913 [Stentor coeruleus]|uniref:CFA20 domain-containing protein n=1 Tax=Stentor coeruleus TaxID=5963 RepID=A0A1R2CGV8_9CILI|nr:hypothetical protein SteCoe_9913 [Stentor coeruleus]
MFQNAFQGGPSVEVLYSCDKNPSWSINKSNWKLYEKIVKGYVILIDSHNIKLNIPSNDKQNLALVQAYLVLQIFIMPTQPFTLELVITDISNSKRRLVFSSASKELIVNPLHARIPNITFVRGIWANISIDMVRIVNSCFTHNTFRSLDSITIYSFCKIRRIFTMRNPLMDTTGNEIHAEGVEAVPKSMDFPGGVMFVNQLITPDVVLPIIVENVEIKNTPKATLSRPPLTTAPIEKPKRQEIRTSSLNKKQGNTTTTFFQRKKEVSSPQNKDAIKFIKPESLRQSTRLGTAGSNRYCQKNEEEKILKEETSTENPLENEGEEIEESIKSNEFHHLTNYHDSDEVMSNSIEEEIEIDNYQQENVVYHPEVYAQPDHNYFPHEIQEEETPKPTFFSLGMNQATQYRPYTPPFAGMNSIKNITVPDESPEEEAVELVYDPVLQCYYDPTTMEYYQVNE